MFKREEERRPRRVLGRTRAATPFAGFFERDALRESRRRARRRTLIVSVVVHLLAATLVLFFSVWKIEEMWAPSVPVKIFTTRTAPPEAVKIWKRPGKGAPVGLPPPASAR